MNALKISLICVSFLLVSQSGKSQDNVIKLGLTGLPIGQIGLSYERVMAEKQSLVINAGVLIPRKLPGILVTSAELGDNSKLSGFSIVPEYRFYLTGRKKDAPRGFYVAPYLTVSNYSVKFSDKYETHNIDIKGSLFIAGAGAQIGIQWLISDVVSIDWTIIGLGISRYSVQADLSSKDAGVNFPQMEADLKDEIVDAPIIGDKLKTNSGNDFMSVKLPIVHVGVRSAFSIGIAF
jgi:hypothetical protein